MNVHREITAKRKRQLDHSLAEYANTICFTSMLNSQPVPSGSFLSTAANLNCIHSNSCRSTSQVPIITMASVFLSSRSPSPLWIHVHTPGWQKPSITPYTHHSLLLLYYSPFPATFLPPTLPLSKPATKCAPNGLAFPCLLLECNTDIFPTPIACYSSPALPHNIMPPQPHNPSHQERPQPGHKYIYKDLPHKSTQLLLKTRTKSLL